MVITMKGRFQKIRKMGGEHTIIAMGKIMGYLLMIKYMAMGRFYFLTGKNMKELEQWHETWNRNTQVPQ
jgi:hypothetical protein